MGITNKKIERLRRELNNQVVSHKNDLLHCKVLEISCLLDQLIVEAQRSKAEQPPMLIAK
jgi:hypothetical protein